AYLDARNNIYISLVLRRPVLRVLDNNGLNYYLDEEGYKLPLSRHFTARVLVATGHLPPHVTDYLEQEQNLLREVFLLGQQLIEDDFLRSLIEQIYVTNRGELNLVPKVGDQKILLGHYDDIDNKLENLKIFYREALPYEGWQKYGKIDLRFRGQIICARR
ncbi:MAG: cell division protein FtsQ/DivIB, partial [Saprospiraceae bacterium]|nr:cell division protein FtsQ/DivIB [Saprospiraceae bacterium]